jgi:NADH:ubiquinone reductase (non-electrogenic)
MEFNNIILIFESDFKNKSLQYEPVPSDSESQNTQPITLNFDKIIICIGQTPNNQEIEGVYEHALFMSQLEDAQKLYKAILNSKKPRL